MSEFTHFSVGPEHALPELSRRRLLGAGFAGLSATAVPAAIGWGPSPAAAALPTVRPISSQAAYSALGVCVMPNHLSTPYRYTSQWVAAVAQTGATYFRGMYAHELSSTMADVTRAARSHDVKWGMLVCPDLSYSDSALVAKIKHIATNAADRCLYVEGINEPNYVRSTGAIPPDWVRRTVAKQRVIWQTVKGDSRLSHVKVLGPKLQAVVGTESHYQALGAAGLAQYMDIAALPCYPSGLYPYQMLDQRLAWVRRYWGGKPAWISETGYNNALAATRGHPPVPEDVAAIYAPSLLLEAMDHGCRGVALFELLDSPNTAKTDVEANFGFFAMQGGQAPPWRAKPIVSSVRSLLNGLEDPGPAYTPASIALGVTSSAGDVRSTVTAKRNGSATVHLRRSKNCWYAGRKSRIAVPEVAVKIQTAQSTRTVMVGSHVRSFSL